MPITPNSGNLHPILHSDGLRKIIDKNNDNILATNFLKQDAGNVKALTTVSSNLADAVNELHTGLGNVSILTTYFSSATATEALIELLNMVAGGVESSGGGGQTFSGMFTGSVIVTPTGYDYRYRPSFSNTEGNYTVTNFQATCSTFLGASGNTVIKLADSPTGTSPGSEMSLDLPYNDGFESNTTSISLPKGSTLYVYCSSSADHQDLQFNFTVEG